MRIQTFFQNLFKKEDQSSLKKLASSQLKVKIFRLEEKCGKQDFHYDEEDLLEPITKTIKCTSETILGESNATTTTVYDFLSKIFMIRPPGAPHEEKSTIATFDPQPNLPIEIARAQKEKNLLKRRKKKSRSSW